jgi:hypothetical protein
MGAFGNEKPGHGALGRAGHQVRAHHEPVAGKPVGESAAEEQEDDLGDRRGAITTPSLVAESPAWPKRQMPARSAPWTCRAASQRARPGHSGTRAHAGGRDRAAPSPLARHSRTLPPGSQSGQATDYRAAGQHATLHSAASGSTPAPWHARARITSMTVGSGQTALIVLRGNSGRQEHGGGCAGRCLRPGRCLGAAGCPAPDDSPGEGAARAGDIGDWLSAQGSSRHRVRGA